MNGLKRLLALLAGALGVRALLRRRTRASSPASDLRARLDESRVVAADGTEFESGEAAVDEVEAPGPAEASEDVDARRADVHSRARRAMDDLGSP
ncbi:MAG: hypothetical protein ACRDM1_06545 [Gaiellaceae bacterium]